MVFLWWCFSGGVVVWWCFCGDRWCGGVLVVVFVWWCFCFGVVVFLWWCFCACVFVVVVVVFCGGVFVVVFCVFVIVFLYVFFVKGRLSSHYREVMQRVLTTLV